MNLRFEEAEGFHYLLCGNKQAKGNADGQCIYYLSMEKLAADTVAAIANINCPVIYVCIDDWDDQLTPWPAKGLYRGDADFKGNASDTLKTLTESVIPRIERQEGIECNTRAIAGYSLAGLFAVYAFANSSEFQNIASMSGSFWYEGWLEYLHGLHPSKIGSYAYLSLGSKEKHAKQKILHSVQEDTDETAAILRSWEATVEEHIVPGGHFDNMIERVHAGLKALSSR